MKSFARRASRSRTATPSTAITSRNGTSAEVSSDLTSRKSDRRSRCRARNISDAGRRALPIVLAACVIAPALAQLPRVSPTFPQRAVAAKAPAQAVYFPERLDWQHKKPEEVGMNPALVNEAVQLAIAAETPGPRDMALFPPKRLGKEP